MLSFRRSLVLSLALAAGLGAPLAAAPPAADLALVVHEKTLANGLRVVTVEDHSCPVAAVQVWYRVGSKDEDPERQGFAHMFEHMMFRGTDRLGPEGHFEFVRGVGGDCNAYTSFDQTVYVQTVPADQVAGVLWLEAERMAALRVDEEGFAIERAVVEEERRLGLNQPYGSVLERLLERLFTVHPYRWSTIGQIEHLRRATSEELLRFWETYYVPNNATLVVVGDVDHEAVEDDAERAFGWIPRCADPPRIDVEEPARDAPLEIELEEDKGPLPIVAVAYRAVPMGHPDEVPLQLLMAILGGGESSRIYRALVEEEEIAMMAMGGAFHLEQAGFAGLAAILLPIGNGDAALARIDAELERVIAEGVTEAELDKAKANALRGRINQMVTVESKARMVGEAMVFRGGAGALRELPERIRATTVADLQRVAATWFVPERRVVVRIKPTLGGMLRGLLGGLTGGAKDGAGAAEKETGKTAAPETSTMAQRQGPKASARLPEGRPDAPPRRPPAAIDVALDSVSRRLDNGMEVVVVENHEVPLAWVRLGFTSGAWLEPREHPAAASMAAEMLLKGTERHDARELAEDLEGQAISLSANAGHDSMSVSGSADAAKLVRLAQTLAEVTRTPTFPAKEFAKLKKRGLAALQLAEKQPEARAERAFASVLFGEHTYGRPAGGTTDQLKALEVGHCAEFWRAAARPEWATLYVAGDVDPERVFELAEVLFGDWRVTVPAPRASDAAPPERAATAIRLDDDPRAVQSQIRVGQLGFARSDARRPLARLLGQVFGGAFNSRLNKSLRVEKGLTYGARGGWSTERFGGTFSISTFSKTATTAQAVRAILDEVTRLREEPPSAAELEQARSYLVGSFPGSVETPAAVAGQLWSLKLHGLTPADVKADLQAYVAATADDLLEFARANVDPEKLAIVVVGDAKLVRADLEEIAPVAGDAPQERPDEPLEPAEGSR